MLLPPDPFLIFLLAYEIMMQDGGGLTPPPPRQAWYRLILKNSVVLSLPFTCVPSAGDAEQMNISK